MSFKGNLFGVFQKPIIILKKVLSINYPGFPYHINITDNMEVEEMVISRNGSSLQMVRIAKPQ